MLWDVYKQYYANLQEGVGAVVHYGSITPSSQTITSISISQPGAVFGLPRVPSTATTMPFLVAGASITVNFTGTAPDLKQIMLNLQDGRLISVYDLASGAVIAPNATSRVAYSTIVTGKQIGRAHV